jgi:cbb3-type cytochrome oxidase subunit 3
MKKVLVLALCGISLFAAVAAAEPAEVAPLVAQEGYFIELGADATDAVVGRAVSDARSAGSRFFVVVLAEEPASGATFYADAILDRLPGQDGTVLVVAPETVGWASNDDVWTPDELNDALDASLGGSTSDDVVTIFVSELIEPSASGRSAGLWLLAIAVVVVAVIGFIVWRSRRSSRERAARALDQMKAETQLRIDALANDILDDEDEIAEAGNEEADRRFDQATAIYAEAADGLQKAESPAVVVAVASRVDVAIWHLDCAEAILDGQPLPPKPEPPKPDAPAHRPAAADGGTAPSTVAPLPPYTRRSTRRSNYGAGDMMKTMLAMQAMRAMSRGGFGAGSRSGSRTSSRSTGGSRSSSRSSGRSRGGGRRRS